MNIKTMTTGDLYQRREWLKLSKDIQSGHRPIVDGFNCEEVEAKLLEVNDEIRRRGGDEDTPTAIATAAKESMAVADMPQDALVRELQYLEFREQLLRTICNQNESKSLEIQSEIYRRTKEPPQGAAVREGKAEEMADKCEPTDEEVVKWYKERAAINCMCTSVFPENINGVDLAVSFNVARPADTFKCPCKCHPDVQWTWNRQYVLTLRSRPSVGGDKQFHVDLVNSETQTPKQWNGRNFGAIMRLLADFIIPEDKR